MKCQVVEWEQTELPVSGVHPGNGYYFMCGKPGRLVQFFGDSEYGAGGEVVVGMCKEHRVEYKETINEGFAKWKRIPR